MRYSLSAVCQPVAPVCGALTAVMALTGFSESLKVGENFTVYAAEDEQHLEGPFWLARITAMTTADEDYVTYHETSAPHASGTIRRAYLALCDCLLLNL